MKRLFGSIIGVSLFYVMAVVQPTEAQPRLGDYSQRGVASQEMSSQGFVAAHPSLPLNSKVKIINPGNNKEVEVSIIARIAPSANRIIDLSFAAMEVLEMKEGGTVILTIGSSAPVSRSSGYDDTIVDLFEPFLPPVEKTSETTVIDKTAEVKTDYASDNKDEKNAFALLRRNSRTDTEFLAWLMAAAVDARQAREVRESSEIREAREIRESREIREARDARESREVREARYREDAERSNVKNNAASEADYVPFTNTAPPPPVQAEAVQIVPGLPDRNSGKIYRLQVGAYSVPEAADRAAEIVKSAGFNVEREYTGSFYRVLAAGIGSADVYSASIRLGSIGFAQIWVRE